MPRGPWCNVKPAPADGSHTTLHMDLKQSFRTTVICPVGGGGWGDRVSGALCGLAGGVICVETNSREYTTHSI